MSSEGFDITERINIRGDIKKHPKYLIAAYPVLSLLIFFFIPFLILLTHSFFQNISGGFYEPAFVFENYIRLFTTSAYFGRLVFTIEIAVVVTIVSLIVSYPLAYYLARTEDKLFRDICFISIISTLWITYVIKGYAWTVILSRNGIVSQVGVAVGLLNEPTSFTPGYWSLVVGLVYVLLPFMLLTLFVSLKGINPKLEEASKSLGASHYQTFKNVTLPLSMNGIIAGSSLVFILTVGTYVLPRILGNPEQWTLAVIIGDQINQQGNIPFAAAMSITLMILVIGVLTLVVFFSDLDIVSLGRGDDL